MKTMTDQTAHEVIVQMMKTAESDVASLKRRIKELKDRYAEVANEDTAGQIVKVEARHEKRVQEAAALAIAAAKF